MNTTLKELISEKVKISPIHKTTFLSVLNLITDILMSKYDLLNCIVETNDTNSSFYARLKEGDEASLTLWIYRAHLRGHYGYSENTYHLSIHLSKAILVETEVGESIFNKWYLTLSEEKRLFLELNYSLEVFKSRVIEEDDD